MMHEEFHQGAADSSMSCGSASGWLVLLQLSCSFARTVLATNWVEYVTAQRKGATEWSLALLLALLMFQHIAHHHDSS